MVSLAGDANDALAHGISNPSDAHLPVLEGDNITAARDQQTEMSVNNETALGVVCFNS